MRQSATDSRKIEPNTLLADEHHGVDFSVRIVIGSSKS
jgi:hypothetical protein